MKIYTAWKKTEDNKTEFSYTSYRLGDSYERELDRNAFVYGYNFQDIGKAPEEVKKLHEMNDLKNSSRSVIHYSVKTGIDDRKSYYRAGDFSLIESGEAELYLVPVMVCENSYALFPGGKLACAGKLKQVIRLPELPAGYTYTDFWTDGVSVCLAFEEQKFIGVGNAGLVFLPVE